MASDDAAIRLVERAGPPGGWVGDASSHGLAIDLPTDGAPFTWIHPCGMTSGAVASLTDLGGRPPALADAGLGLDPEAMDHAG